MKDSSSPFPKKLERGLLLLYEDPEIMVVDKPAGLLSIAREGDASKSLDDISCNAKTDHFGEITEILRDESVDEFVLTGPNMDPQELRKVKNTLMVRYGMTIHNALPNPPAAEVAEKHEKKLKTNVEKS